MADFDNFLQLSFAIDFLLQNLCKEGGGVNYGEQLGYYEINESEQLFGFDITHVQFFLRFHFGRMKLDLLATPPVSVFCLKYRIAIACWTSVLNQWVVIHFYIIFYDTNSVTCFKENLLYYSALN